MGEERGKDEGFGMAREREAGLQRTGGGGSRSGGESKTAPDERLGTLGLESQAGRVFNEGEGLGVSLQPRGER